MLPSKYIETIERKLQWLRFGNERRPRIEAEYGRITETYLDILESSDTFFMDRAFCDLVDHARREAPLDMRFDARWLLAKRGWLWMETPFEVPPVTLEERDLVKLGVRGVGWREVPVGATLVAYDGSQEPAPPGSVQFCFYVDQEHYRSLVSDDAQANLRALQRAAGEWSPWSFFVLRDGALLHERMLDFEERGRRENPEGAYIPTDERIVHPLHEMRWLYAALHLMAQRLATTVEHKVDRATRRRAERTGQTVPPIIRVVTLRRLQLDRVAEKAEADVDWQWRWIVRGFWRNQWYPSENCHKRIFIESYLKGPENRPLKPDTLKLFVARR